MNKVERAEYLDRITRAAGRAEAHGRERLARMLWDMAEDGVDAGTKFRETTRADPPTPDAREDES